MPISPRHSQLPRRIFRSSRGRGLLTVRMFITMPVPMGLPVPKVSLPLILTTQSHLIRIIHSIGLPTVQPTRDLSLDPARTIQDKDPQGLLLHGITPTPPQNLVLPIPELRLNPVPATLTPEKDAFNHLPLSRSPTKNSNGTKSLGIKCSNSSRPNISRP